MNYSYTFIKKIVFLSFFICTLQLLAQKTDKVRLMFIGDIMNHGPQLKAAYHPFKNTYDFSNNFKYVDSIFQKADFVIGNLETTLGVQPYSGYPQFSAPPELASDCKKYGFDILATANNHSCDKYKIGIIRTLDILDSLQINRLGTYRNQKEKDSLYPLVLEKNNIKIALLNYTYGTNGIPVPYPTIVNLIDKKSIKEDIKKARLKQPDVIIAFLHWGKQYQNIPSAEQKKLVAFFHQNGVKIIIGAHPHVIQPVSYENNMLNKTQYLTVYSLGNFISNQRKFPRDGGMIFSLELIKEPNGKITIDTYQSIPTWVYKYVKNNKTNYEILPIETFKYRPDYFMQNSDYQKMMRYLKHFNKILKD